jgi:hypothetical protein
MGRHMELVERLRQSVLEGRGKTDPALRQAVAARTGELGGGSPAVGKLPENLRKHVDMIGLHAYRITDEDVDALRQAGYSDDEIFEVCVSAALGAGLARLERGLAALRGGRE